MAKQLIKQFYKDQHWIRYCGVCGVEFRRRSHGNQGAHLNLCIKHRRIKQKADRLIWWNSLTSEQQAEVRAKIRAQDKQFRETQREAYRAKALRSYHRRKYLPHLKFRQHRSTAWRLTHGNLKISPAVSVQPPPENQPPLES